MGSESRQLTILKALAAALDAAGKPTGVTVHRHRERPIDVDDLDSIVVYEAAGPEGTAETVEEDRIGSSRVRRTLTFRTELRIVTSDEEPARDTIDPLYAWVVQALAQNSLGGLLSRGPRELRQSDTQTGAEGERWFAGKAVDWECEFRTQRTDPTEA